MNKQDIHTSTLDLIREETRSGKLVRYADVLGDLPSVVSAIDVDKENVINGIKHAIWDNSDGNPLNAILKYLGLRLVSNRDLERDSQSRAGILDDALKLDKEKLTASVHQMAAKLAEHEETSSKLNADNKKLIAELHSQLDAEKGKSRRLSASYQGLRETVAVRLQYILSLMGLTPAEDLVYQQIQEMMEDMQFTAFWSAESSNLSESEMFTIMTTDDISSHKSKPCLVYRGEVVAKGVLFTEK